jgi:hypothetical protein
MNTNTHAVDRRALLSTIWIFAVLNYLYCDLLSLMDAPVLKQYLTGTVGSIQFTQGFLLGAGMLMEISMAMVLLSRVLPYKANRWANIVAGVITTAVQLGSLTLGTSTPYYWFFSVIENAATVSIVWLAWTWRPARGPVESVTPSASFHPQTLGK